MRPEREKFRKAEAAYFISTQTTGRKPFFRHERWARLMVATIQRYGEKDYILHAYVVMPDHLHLLITPAESVEKAVQLIKGGFSFRAKRELEWNGEVWQQGFTDHRVRDEEDWKRHLDYIRTNPIEAKLVSDSVLYEYMGFQNIAFPQGLKPAELSAEDVRAKARTLQSEARTFQPGTTTGTPEAVPFQNKGASSDKAEVVDLQNNDTPSGTAEAVPFQSSEEPDVRARARTLHL